MALATSKKSSLGASLMTRPPSPVPRRSRKPLAGLILLWNGVLPGGYATDLPVTPQTLTLAAAGVEQALTTLPLRQRVQVLLRVRVDSFFGTCATLETLDNPPTIVNLFDADGFVLAFPDAFLLPAGTILSFDGYFSAASANCPGTKFEALSATVVTLPPSPSEDQNQNGLPDDWELLFLGGLSQNPLEDSDKDQYSDLEELLGGSDPQDPGNVPLFPVMDLTPPELAISISPAGHIEVHWVGKGQFPANLANLNYVVLAGATLDSILTPVAQHSASGTGGVSLQLPPPVNVTATFYRLGLCWGNCQK